MSAVRFVLEGSSEFTAPMPELPRTGETVMADGAIHVITDAVWSIAGG